MSSLVYSEDSGRTLLARYIAGEHEAVWAEMLVGRDKFGAAVTPSEAELVATETMRRVRANGEILVEKLGALGFAFGVYSDGSALPGIPKPLGEPFPTIEKLLTELERKTGPIPLSLKAFWREVGSVNLTGRKENWAGYCWDQLWVESVETARWSLEEWREIIDDVGEEEAGPFLLILSPDILHKGNVSGGQEYGIIMPNADADAPFHNDLRQETFVEHLRHSLRWGGFPGFEGDPDAPHQDIAFLCDGLLPF